MRILSYVMVTYNRPLIVKEYIKTTKDYFMDKDILLTIIDGSENHETEKMISEYNYSFIKYYHFKNLSFSERIFKGINYSESQYICITGDSQLPIIENLDRAFKLMDNGYDLINLSYRDNKKIKNKDYDNIIDMCRANCWDMTLFGTVFFKKSSYNFKIINELLNKEYDMLAYNIFYFNNFIGNKFSGHYEALPIIKISKIKNNASYNIFVNFTKFWYYVVHAFDEKYNKYKEDIIFDHSKYSSLKLNTIRGIMRFRVNDSFNKEYLKENEEILSVVTHLSYWKLYLITCVPKCICIIMYDIYRKLFRR